AEARKLETRAKGLRVKRPRIEDDPPGVNYSFELLENVLNHSPTSTHRCERFTLDMSWHKLLETVAERLGVGVGPEANPGARPEETTDEASIQELADRLISMIDGLAERGESMIWLFIETDDPSLSIRERVRLEIEALMAATLRARRVRIVLAGFEMIGTPGIEFRNAGAAMITDDQPRSPGLIVEIMGTAHRSDVREVLRLASDDLRLGLTDQQLDASTDTALVGLQNDNDFYPGTQIREIAKRLRDNLAVLHHEYAVRDPANLVDVMANIEGR
ncbi:MAG: hypothetical protein AAFQ17_04585, partial [Pseudomonadota bacterium]